MHRVKGLEFEHVIIVAENQGILPLDAAVVDAEDAVAKRNADTGERSLLYVAVTRARRSATITGYGQMSQYVATAAQDAADNRVPESSRKTSRIARSPGTA
jgi:superfamily I DNA/RNA helicase